MVVLHGKCKIEEVDLSAVNLTFIRQSPARDTVILDVIGLCRILSLFKYLSLASIIALSKRTLLAVLL